MLSKQTLLLLGLCLIIVLIGYKFVPLPDDDQAISTADHFHLRGIVLITFAGFVLLITIAVLLIKDHHYYGKGNKTAAGQRTYLQLLKDEESRAVIITNASGMVIYMNNMAQQITHHRYAGDTCKGLHEIYRLQVGQTGDLRRQWKAVPDGSGMMTEKETRILISLDGSSMRISQQVFHFFDNRGDIQEKVIAFITEPYANT